MHLGKICKKIYNKVEKRLITEQKFDGQNRILQAARTLVTETNYIRIKNTLVLDMCREITNCALGRVNSDSVLLTKKFNLTFEQFDQLSVCFRIALLEYIIANENIEKAIISLIEFSKIDFDELREKCLVQEQIISNSEDYIISDKSTVNFIRKRIGLLAKKYDVSEIDIATACTETDDGVLNVLFGSDDAKNKKTAFFGAVAVLSLVIVLSCHTFTQSLFFTLISIVPVTAFVYKVLSGIFVRFGAKRVVAKLNNTPEVKTAVVLTKIVSSKAEAEKSIRTLEEYHCANNLQNGVYVLCADLPCADEPEEKVDGVIMTALKDGFEKLNRENDCFSLVLRKRQKYADGCYGYERKRGALKQLAEFIRFNKNPFALCINGEKLKDAKYIATFDSDTIVPPGTVENMIKIIAHPFNQPIMKDNKVVLGHALVSPTVCNTIDNRTLFGKIFAFDGGMDCYNGGTVEMYNDVFLDGTFCGKGIFSIDEFLKISELIEDNTILSHDILEGELLSAISCNETVFDEFPQNPISYFKRSERWMRGDWLLLPWLFKKIPIISKQKILFNIINDISIFFVFLQLTFAPILGIKAYLIWLILVLLFFYDTLIVGLNSVGKEKNFKYDLKEVVRYRLLQNITQFVFLPFSAFVRFSSCVKALFRRFVSHKKILEWNAFSQRGADKKGYYRFMLSGIVIGAIAYSVSVYYGVGIFVFLLFVVGWLLSAEIAFLMGKINKREETHLLKEDSDALNILAIRYLNFFFDGLKNNKIIPDNFRFKFGYAFRTSPTNIGFSMLYPFCAYSLGVFSAGQTVKSISDQYESINKLPRFKGHLYNWYNLENNMPLNDYVSTVDSGNYLACLVVLTQIKDDLLSVKPLSQKRIQGICYLVDAVSQECTEDERAYLIQAKNELCEAKNKCKMLKQIKLVAKSDYADFLHECIQSQVEEYEQLSFGDIEGIDKYPALAEELSRYPKSPKEVLEENFDITQYAVADGELRHNLNKQYKKIYSYAKKIESDIDSLIYKINSEISALDFSFLFDDKKELLYIGYDIQNKKANGHYDMLMSEARLTTFLLIALNKIPPQSWFKMSRVFSRSVDRPMCLSWGGTMFEYLMPDIFISCNENSMLYRSCVQAVENQTRMKKDGIWGISESSYGRKDPSGEYSYRAFGIPANAYYEIEEKNVFAPYASMLAIEYAPQQVMENVHCLVQNGFLKKYGFVEAIDFSKNRPMPCNVFMAHHSGMSLCALTNFLCSGIIRNTFLRSNAMDSCKVLLEEKMPMGVVRQIPVDDFQKNPNNIEIVDEKFENDQIIPLTNGDITLFASAKGKIEIFEQNLCLITEGYLFISDVETVSATTEPCFTDQVKYKTKFYNNRVEYEFLYSGIKGNITLFLQNDKREMFIDYHLTNLDGTEKNKKISFFAKCVLNDYEKYNSHPYFNGLKICKKGNSLINFDTGLRCNMISQKVVTDYESIFASGKTAVPDLEAEDKNSPIKCILMQDSVTLGPNEKKRGTMMLSFDDSKKIPCPAAVTLALDRAYIPKEWLRLTDNEFKNLLSVCAKIKNNERFCVTCTPKNESIWRFGISEKIPLIFIEINNFYKIKPLLKILSCLTNMQFNILISHDTNEDYMLEDFYMLEKSIPQCLAERVKHVKRNCIIDSEEIKNLCCIYADDNFEFEKLEKKKKHLKRSIELPQNTVPLNGKFDNGYGKYINSGYYIYKRPPIKWSNILSNGKIGCIVSSNGEMFNFAENSCMEKLTAWGNDASVDKYNEAVILENGESVRSIAPILGNEVECLLARGYCRFRRVFFDNEETQTVFVHQNLPIKVTRITSGRKEKIKLYYSCKPQLGQSENKNIFLFEKFCAACATNGKKIMFLYSPECKCVMGTGDVSAPPLVHTESPDIIGIEKCFEKQCDLFLGVAENEQELCRLIDVINNADVNAWQEESKLYWEEICDRVRIKTPDEQLNTVFPFLSYQTVVSRMLARAGLYQAGGAYGFRDQLQDCLAVAYMDPQMARKHILDCAGHQFVEGDVQHWWHPEFLGVRTKISDDLLFLPYVACKYVSQTGDEKIFDEIVPYIEGHRLFDKKDIYENAWQSDISENLFEHCKRAISLVVERTGPNGLPLIMSGDWNDGMDNLGDDKNGESVWLGWFLFYVIGQFIPICKKRDSQFANDLTAVAKRLVHVLNNNCWDAKWYIRAIDKNDRRIGSKDQRCCQIDLISQAWSVLSGAGDSKKSETAINSAMERLVDWRGGIVKLLDPPFDREYNAGYIGKYAPGVRENGGQYTHGAIWLARALAQMNRNDEFFEILKMINPIAHGDTKRKIDEYKTEPYVISADIYTNYHGGWSWYTGSASLYYCCILEDLLGYSSDKKISPHIPKTWKEYEMTVGEKTIKVFNPENHDSGCKTVTEKGNEIRVIM